MTIQMNIAEAKAKLSELVARAESGEEVIIARDGKPVVTLSPRAPLERRLGLWDHLGENLPENLFVGPDPEIEEAMVIWEAASIYPPA